MNIFYKHYFFMIQICAFLAIVTSDLSRRIYFKQLIFQHVRSFGLKVFVKRIAIV